MRTKINDLESLKAEKLRIKMEARAYNQKIKQDFDRLKEYYTLKRILLRTGVVALPEIVGALMMLRSPINFVKNNLFHMGNKASDAEAKTNSQEDKNTEAKPQYRIKNIAFGIVEALGPILLSRYLRKKI